MSYFGKPAFPGEKQATLALLSAMRAHDEWAKGGGLDRLRKAFAAVRISNAAPEPDAAHAAIYERQAINGRFDWSGPVACDALGNLYPVPDAVPGSLIDHEKDPDYITARNRLAAMMEVMERDTGNAVDPAKAVEAYARREELKAQTIEIARRLASQGIDVWRKTPFDLFTYFIHSGAVVREEQLRRVMFLPAVAALVRKPKVNALEYFCQRHPFARMMTFTSGPRTPLYGLRQEIQTHHRALSRLASWMRLKWGVKMVFRSTELGEPERTESGRVNPAAGLIVRDAAGVPTFHVHSHCLTHQDKPMNPARWDEFIKAVWKKWGHIWDVGRSVSDVRELCKYVTKPGAVLELSPAELAELYRQLERLKLVVTLGSLRVEIRDRKDREMRLDRQPTPEGRVWREVTDWNRHGKEKPRDEKGERIAAGFSLRSKCDEPDEIPARIVGRLAPSFAPGSIVTEPRVCVLAVRWDRNEIDRNPMVAELRRSTADQWAAALALNEFAPVLARASAHASALRVHVGSPTVHGVPEGSAWLPDLGPPEPAPDLVPGRN